MGWPLLHEVAPADTSGSIAKGPTYICAYSKDDVQQPEGIESLYHLFARSCKQNADRPALGWRKIVEGNAQPFEYMSYSEVEQKVAALSAAYLNLGLNPKDRVGIYGANSPEWMIGLQACSRVNLCCVPLYDTLGASAVEHICGHAEVKLVLVSSASLSLFLEVVPRLKESLAAIVYWGEPQKNTPKTVEGLDTKLISFEEMLSSGEEHPHAPIPPSAEDLTTLMYTSGTTGTPKGVMLTHRALLTDMRGIERFLEHTGFTDALRGSALSYLPLAHIFGRILEETMLSLGARVGYWQGDPRKLTDDIQACKPTLFAGVPRVFERVYSGIRTKVSKGGLLTRFVFRCAYMWKLMWVKLGFAPSKASYVADALVFTKMKSAFGGKVQVMLSGGAPMSHQLQEFLTVAFSCPVVQGYGLTETCAASCVSMPKASHWGCVGPTVPGVEFRLEAVPEMNCNPLAHKQQGEVCLRGDTLFSGYYKEEDKTNEVMDDDGFFHTGDVGEIIKDGAIKIIDRKKNIFKLSQGEYIAVEHLESVFGQAKIVDQIWVYGNSHEAVLVAVIVPDSGILTKWASDSGDANKSDFKALCKSKAAEKYVLQQLDQRAKEAKLKGFEKIKAVHLDAEPFSIENDLMTAKMSLKRVSLLKHYKKQIDGLYGVLKKSS